MRNDELDHDAMVAAIRILVDAAAGCSGTAPFAAWGLVWNAATRLNVELARYYRGPADPEKGDR